MSTLTATRIRLYPTPAQEDAFRCIAGCCRLVYNAALEQRRDFWRAKRAATGTGFSWIEQKRELLAMKQDMPFLKEVPAHCLQMALQDLDRAYGRFFDGAGGYPKPRRKFENDSFTFPDPAQIRIDVAGGRLILPKFGRRTNDAGPIRARYHRKLYGRVRRVTISREGVHWYASILMRVRRSAPAPHPIAADGVVAIDRGVAHAVVTSDGTMLDMPAQTPRQIERGRRLARALSRKKRGSNNRRKALLALRAHKAKMVRLRRDRMHKITHAIVKTCTENQGAVVIEKLRVQAMTASAKGSVETPGRNVAAKSGLNRRILESGWGEMRRQLTYKLKRSGGRLIDVSARHTSQTCANCGTVDPASRQTQALFQCTRCGHTAHADVNAAIEIRRRGLQALGLSPPAGTVGAARGALCPSMAMKREEQKIDVSAMPQETAA